MGLPRKMTMHFDRMARSSGTAALMAASLLLVFISGSGAAFAEASPALAAGQDIGSGSSGPITVRRSMGLAFLAGSALLVVQGFDLKDEADEFYDSYNLATDRAEMEKFYQRTTNRDVKSQVSWALAAAFGITGLRLIFTGGEPAATARHNALTSPAPRPGGPSVSLVPAVTPRVVGLRLQRHFY
jgi:hypothetical protein